MDKRKILIQLDSDPQPSVFDRVLGGTGPVGRRVALLLARPGAEVRIGSRQQSRAAAVCAEIGARVPGARLQPVAPGGPVELAAALEGRSLVVAAGAAGAVLLP